MFGINRYDCTHVYDANFATHEIHILINYTGFSVERNGSRCLLLQISKIMKYKYVLFYQ